MDTIKPTFVNINNKKVGFFGNPLGGYKDKFNRVIKLAQQWDYLNTKFNSFLSVSNVTERFQCALAMKIMMKTGVRIGNEDSATGYHSKISKKEVQTYGLTTLKKQHITFDKDTVIFNFVGKRQVQQKIRITDKELTKQIKKVYDSVEGSNFLNISDYELRKFVKKSVGKNFMVKDFRTVKANIEAWHFSQSIINNEEFPRTKSEANKEVKSITEAVSIILGNTSAICKRSYIHSALLEYHLQERYYNA